MKHTKLFLILLFAPVMIGCQKPSTPEPNDPILESISLSGTYQTVFSIDDEFNYDGLVVTAHYDNNTDFVVAPSDVSSPDMSSEGEKEVVVTYETVHTSYTIRVNETIDPEPHGYISLAFYNIDIALNDSSRHYLNPTPVGYESDPDLVMPFTFESSDTSIATVSNGGGVQSAKNKTGTCTITVTGDTGLKAKCIVNVLETLPVKEKAWVQLNDYDSLSDGDILVMASPNHGVTASLDTLHSKLNPVTSTFSSDLKRITSLGESTIEFVLGIEDKGMTLESQTGEYLKCTHQGKVLLDSSLKTNRYWDIHSNYDPETGEGSIADGAVIENDVESLGYFMFNVSQNYFTTYVDNSIMPNVMELPFLYRLEYVD